MRSTVTVMIDLPPIGVSALRPVSNLCESKETRESMISGRTSAGAEVTGDRLAGILAWEEP